jgi:hypothetical protein
MSTWASAPGKALVLVEQLASEPAAIVAVAELIVGALSERAGVVVVELIVGALSERAGAVVAERIEGALSALVAPAEWAEELIVVLALVVPLEVAAAWASVGKWVIESGRRVRRWMLVRDSASKRLQIWATWVDWS